MFKECAIKPTNICDKLHAVKSITDLFFYLGARFHALLRTQGVEKQPTPRVIFITTSRSNEAVICTTFLIPLVFLQRPQTYVPVYKLSEQK